MKSILHSFNKAIFSAPNLFSYSLKAGYILSDETISIGSVADIMSFKFQSKNCSIKNKCKILLNSYDSETDKDNIEFINNYLMMDKVIKSKHYPTSIFIKFKAMEKLISNDFKEWSDYKIAEIEDYGFYQFESLIDGNALGYLYIRGEQKNEHGKEQFILDLENLITLKIPALETSESLIVLNDLFYQKEIIQEQLFESPLQDLVSGSYVYPILQLPGIQNYSTLELKTTRASLIGPLKEFRTLVDEWSILCNTSEDLNASHSFFKNNIIPIADSVNDVIKTHPVMKYHLEQYKDSGAYILLGEVTKNVLLNYYLHFDYINKEKLEELKAKFIADNEWNRRVPVLFVSKTATLSLPTEFDLINSGEFDENGTIKSTRKFISLD